MELKLRFDILNNLINGLLIVPYGIETRILKLADKRNKDF